MTLPSALLTLATSLLLGVVAPWLFMRMLVPSLEQGQLATNYRGKQVFSGLGVVWLFWAGAAIIAGMLSSDFEGRSILAVLMLAGPLALVAFAVGVVDDAYGTGGDRGFRGHLRAMRQGRLTTGAVKLLGVSAASFVVAVVISGFAQWASVGLLNRVLLALPAGAAIALTANFVNLTDLRPGRALKVYSLLAVGGVVSTVLGVRIENVSRGPVLLEMLALALFVLGPVVAVWRFDLGERGMLGDSGANAMGAVAGMLIVMGLPLWGMLGYLAVLFALNLASERVSFSKVIEANSALRRLDMIGRQAQQTE